MALTAEERDKIQAGLNRIRSSRDNAVGLSLTDVLDERDAPSQAVDEEDRTGEEFGVLDTLFNPEAASEKGKFVDPDVGLTGPARVLTGARSGIIQSKVGRAIMSRIDPDTLAAAELFDATHEDPYSNVGDIAGEIFTELPAFVAGGAIVGGAAKTAKLAPIVAKMAQSPVGRTGLRGTFGSTQFALADIIMGRAQDIPRDAFTGFAFGIAGAPQRLIRRAIAQATAGAIVAPEGSRGQVAGIAGALAVLGGPTRIPVPKRKLQVQMGSRSEKAQTAIMDRFAPVLHFEQAIEDAVGKAILPAQSVYRAVRLYAGIPGRQVNSTNRLGDIVRPVKKNMDDLDVVLAARRSIELKGRGIKKLPHDVVTFNKRKAIDISNPDKALRQVRKKVGEDKFRQLMKAADDVTAFNDSILLKDALDAGLISRKSFAAIKKSNQKFVHFDLLENITDDVAAKSVTGGRVAIGSQTSVKRIRGSRSAIDSPMTAQVRRIYKIHAQAEQNRVAGRMLQTRDRVLAAKGKAAKEYRDIIRPLGKNGKTKPGEGKMTFFNDGVKQEFAVPKPIADTLTGMTQENIDFISRLAGFGGSALRAGATTFNIGFAVTNPIRDFQLAKLVSRQMGIKFNARVWTSGFAHAIGRGRLYDQFERELGSFGGFFSRLGSTAGFGTEAPKKALKIASRGKISKTARTIVNPFEWIRAAGETLELAPRLGIFRQAMKQGLSAQEAAFAARNSTIDFARMGTKMKIFNMWIPFLNARVQGTANMFGAVKNNPTGSAMVIAGIVTVPQTMTYLWNTRMFPKVYKDISDFEKENNFLMIYGDDQDKSGRYTQVLKIPKGDVGRVFGNPQQAFMEYADGIDPEAMNQVFIQMASDVSPADFDRRGEFSFEKLTGSLLPPTAQAAALGVGALDRELFTGRTIVPASLENVSPHLQFTRNTSETAKAVGRLTKDFPQGLKASPARLEAAVQKQFAGLGRTALTLSDRAFYGQAIPQSRVPLIRRFSGAFGRGEDEKRFKSLVRLNRRVEDYQAIKRQKAELVAQRIESTDDKFKKRDIFSKAIEEGVDMNDIRRVLQRGQMTPLERSLKNKPVMTRAAFIIQELQARGTKSAKRAFMIRMKTLGILTDDVMQTMITGKRK